MSEFDKSLKKIGIKRSRGYEFYFKNYIFSSIDFRGKTILDVGGGNGIASFYAVKYLGAKSSLVIDPLEDGSNDEMHSQYDAFLDLFGKGVEFYQGYTNELADEKKYDVLLLHNVINHVGEDIVHKLHYDNDTKIIFKERICDILSKGKLGGHLIVADCGRRNIFGDLKIHNPIAPTINWSIHQQPHVWQEIMEEIGCKHLKTNWTARRELGFYGKFLLSNPLISYLTNSTFVSFYKIES